MKPGQSLSHYRLVEEIGQGGMGVVFKAYASRRVALDPHEVSTLYNVACLYAMAGRIPKALDLLQKAVDAGFAQRARIEHDGDLDALRDEPRFKAILKRLQN